MKFLKLPNEIIEIIYNYCKCRTRLSLMCALSNDMKLYQHYGFYKEKYNEYRNIKKRINRFNLVKIIDKKRARIINPDKIDLYSDYYTIKKPFFFTNFTNNLCNFKFGDKIKDIGDNILVVEHATYLKYIHYKEILDHIFMNSKYYRVYYDSIKKYIKGTIKFKDDFSSTNIYDNIVFTPLKKYKGKYIKKFLNYEDIDDIICDKHYNRILKTKK